MPASCRQWHTNVMEHSKDNSSISAEETSERLIRHLEDISAEPEKWQPDDDEMSHNFKKIIESAANYKPDETTDNS